MDWYQAPRRLLQLATGQRPALVPPSPQSAAEPGPEALVARMPAAACSQAPARAAHGRAADAQPPAAAGEEPAGAGLHQDEAAVGAPGVARSLCIASGKGGTGKSVVTASLASRFAAGGRTLIVDADLGVGNAHILQDVSPAMSFVDVVEGRREVRETRVACGERLDLLAAGSGVPRMAELTGYELHLIASGLEQVEAEYRWVFVDSAAGLSRQTVSFARACDAVLIVTTPDLTAMTDAYAFLKVLLARRPDFEPWILVNRAGSPEEAQEVASRIARVTARFLQRGARWIGWLPEDPVVTQCANRRGPVVALEPHAPFSYSLRRVADALAVELERIEPRGLGRTLARDVGYERPTA
jgi:flagellar biosynthesis protein FlhG